MRTFLDDLIVPLDNNLFPWSEKIPEDCRLKKFEWLTHAACKGGIFFAHACGLPFTSIGASLYIPAHENRLHGQLEPL